MERREDADVSECAPVAYELPVDFSFLTVPFRLNASGKQEQWECLFCPRDSPHSTTFLSFFAFSFRRFLENNENNFLVAGK